MGNDDSKIEIKELDNCFFRHCSVSTLRIDLWQHSVSVGQHSKEILSPEYIRTHPARERGQRNF